MKKANKIHFGLRTTSSGDLLSSSFVLAPRRRREGEGHPLGYKRSPSRWIRISRMPHEYQHWQHRVFIPSFHFTICADHIGSVIQECGEWIIVPHSQAVMIHNVCQFHFAPALFLHNARTAIVLSHHTLLNLDLHRCYSRVPAPGQPLFLNSKAWYKNGDARSKKRWRSPCACSTDRGKNTRR